MSNEEGVATMKAWLDARFEAGGRHERRVKKIDGGVG
jgi:ribose 5-phosphate isomerase RpiB